MGNAKYYQEHKEEVKQRARDHYYSHRLQKIAYASQYQIVHKDQKRVWNNHDRQRVRAELLHLLGDVCAVCGTADRIELDHKLAGGTIDRLKRGNNHNMYRYYLKHPEDAKEKLQLLCKRHNLLKQNMNNER